MTPVEPPYASIGAALFAQAELSPDAPALAFAETDQFYSFKQWAQASQALSTGMLALGVRPGDHIALLAQNRLEWPVIELAVALCGAVIVPINTHFGRDEIRYALEHSGARMVFVSNRFRAHSYLEHVLALRPALSDLEHIVTLDEPHPDCLDFHHWQSSDEQLPMVSANDIAALLYTSGTTGFPKGALLSHRAMLFDSWQCVRRLHISSADRWTSIVPLFHCAGCIMNILGCLQAGACYVGVSAFEPTLMFKTIEAQKCTALSGVPTSYMAMLDHPERQHYDLSTLRTGTCGGADANPVLLKTCAREFPIPQLCNVYGLTESATIVACPDCDDDERFDTAGPVLDGCEIRIVNADNGQALPGGEVGHIEVRGPITMREYYANPDATAQTIDEHGWLLTGDLGMLTNSGRLRLAGGRLTDMIIRGGENIYPVEVENLLLEHDAIAQVAVFGMADPYYGETPAAAVILNAPATASALTNFCQGRLAGYKIPRQWYQVEAFPLTASGKVRKVALRAAADAGELAALS